METKSTDESNVDLNKDLSNKSETAQSTSGGDQVGASGVVKMRNQDWKEILLIHLLMMIFLGMDQT